MAQRNGIGQDGLFGECHNDEQRRRHTDDGHHRAVQQINISISHLHAQQLAHNFAQLVGVGFFDAERFKDLDAVELLNHLGEKLGLAQKAQPLVSLERGRDHPKPSVKRHHHGANNQGQPGVDVEEYGQRVNRHEHVDQNASKKAQEKTFQLESVAHALGQVAALERLDVGQRVLVELLIEPGQEVLVQDVAHVNAHKGHVEAGGQIKELEHAQADGKHHQGMQLIGRQHIVNEHLVDEHGQLGRHGREQRREDVDVPDAAVAAQFLQQHEIGVGLGQRGFGACGRGSGRAGAGRFGRRLGRVRLHDERQGSIHHHLGFVLLQRPEMLGQGPRFLIEQ